MSYDRVVLACAASGFLVAFLFFSFFGLVLLLGRNVFSQQGLLVNIMVSNNSGFSILISVFGIMIVIHWHARMADQTTNQLLQLEC